MQESKKMSFMVEGMYPTLFFFFLSLLLLQYIYKECIDFKI